MNTPLHIRPALTSVCFAMVALAASTCASRSQPTAPTEGTAVPAMRIVVLGDSLAVSPTPDESFPAVLQTRLRALGLNWTVANAGVRGDTTTGGRRRADALLGPDVGVLVLALGANDGLRGVDVDTIEDNLSNIIERAQAERIRVLLCGMETPPLHGFEYSVDFHNLFRRVASKYSISLVPFLLAGVALDPGFNGRDGIHPNRAGAERIAETVWLYLEPLVVSARHAD
jgi:acyl-CoA thioesterase-1